MKGALKKKKQSRSATSSSWWSWSWFRRRCCWLFGVAGEIFKSAQRDGLYNGGAREKRADLIVLLGGESKQGASIKHEPNEWSGFIYPFTGRWSPGMKPPPPPPPPSWVASRVGPAISFSRRDFLTRDAQMPVMIPRAHTHYIPRCCRMRPRYIQETRRLYNSLSSDDDGWRLFLVRFSFPRRASIERSFFVLLFITLLRETWNEQLFFFRFYFHFFNATTLLFTFFGVYWKSMIYFFFYFFYVMHPVLRYHKPL